MGKHTRKEFALLCGITPAAVNVNVGRNRIIVGADKLISDSNLYNKEFLRKQQDNQSIKVVTKETPLSKSPPEKAPRQGKGSLAVAAGPSGDEDEIRLKRKFGIDVEIKELELTKKKQEIELRKIALQKAKGKVIPTDLVKDLFTQQFKSVTTSFHQAADNFIMEISKMAGLKREEIAELRGRLIILINEGITDAQVESKRSLKTIVNDYAEKRGVGESKT